MNERKGDTNMATTTNAALNQQVIYELSLYNFSPEHDFDSVVRELDRIKDLGVDLIWLVPIHPRGEEMRLGEKGSPYSVKDYRGINPEHGDFASFARLVEETHKRGMKLLLDVVYNHTSRDSLLAKTHPEFFYHDQEGKPRCRFWQDVYDLDYANQGLCDYMVETALFWAKLGVDGYRCDVAPMVPLHFWRQAKAAMDKVNPDFIWLAETHHYPFLTRMRDQGWQLHADAEMYECFDVTYDYDVHYFYEDYLKGKGSLKAYVDAINRQKAMYPQNYVKLRLLENHDQVRVASLVHTREQLFQWTAFSFFEKGLTMLYAGQEYAVAKRTNVTKAEPFARELCPGLEALIKRLSQIKKLDVFKNGAFTLAEPEQDSILVGTLESADELLVGLFNFRLVTGKARLPLRDGCYENLLGGSITVKDGLCDAPVEPVILRVTDQHTENRPFKEHE